MRSAEIPGFRLLEPDGLPWNAPAHLRNGYAPPDSSKFDHGAYADGLYKDGMIKGRVQRRIRRDLDAEDRSREGDPSRFRALDLNTVEDPPPLVLGADGIFQECGVNYLYGKPNVGKTPLLAWVAIQRVRAGWAQGVRIGVYELEMGPSKWKRLLVELGATPAEIRRIHYYADPAAPEDLLVQGRALCARALDDGCTGLIYDSMVAMLAVSGIEENNPVGIRNLVNNAARPMALAGGSAWIIDHTGHADQDRPRSSSDKMAGCDFAVSMRADAGKDGKRGVSGEYTLICFKDRDARFNGDSMPLRHKASDGGSFTYEPLGWERLALADVKARMSRPTQNPILAYMQRAGRPVTAPEVARELDMNVDAARSALRRGCRGQEPKFMQVEGRDGYWQPRVVG